MADAKRQLQIKTAGLKRVTKELAVYIREEDAESTRVKTLRASGADSHDLKHAVSRYELTWLEECSLLDVSGNASFRHEISPADLLHNLRAQIANCFAAGGCSR